MKKFEPPLTAMVKFGPKDWNFVAKRIREVYPIQEIVIPAGPSVSQIQRRVLEILALAFAYKYQEDNPTFDPIKWLNQCSPDPEMYPLSELWDT